MSSQTNPKQKYIISHMKKLSQAVTAVVMKTMSISDAAEKFDLTESTIQTYIDDLSKQYDTTQNDLHSFTAMAYNNIIQHTLANNLKPEYTRIDDFASLDKTEFCQNMRQKHVSITTMIKLIDLMQEFNILFKDTKDDIDMNEFKNMLDVLR